ncbi:hypothetical protein K7640_15645 [Micromonospora sp. PLK6-60]|uniref:hypothetical protein n=1 Tax=Micromonospora sp. PLK6-60 TaxID=2873383 RepID=UPI001CA6106C|nr:hypothetical protein [Micromonospora sp. PLK6-60]MBY8873269.1 hypothetical protein [Micromonospora sp. PLK6-60]
MLLDPEIENDVAYELCQIVGRSLLPLRGPEAGTAFLFAAATGADYLLTADVLTGGPAAELGLRPSVTEPPGVAPDTLTLPAGDWARRPELGVAVLPMAGLHEQARARGWRWRTQPVTDGLAAGPAVVAAVGAQPASAFVLAQGVRADAARPLEVAVERVLRDGDRVLVDTALPDGYVGAPVFAVDTNVDGDLGVHCLGLVLPADGGRHPVATFDRIRAAVAELPGPAA